LRAGGLLRRLDCRQRFITLAGGQGAERERRLKVDLLSRAGRQRDRFGDRFAAAGVVAAVELHVRDPFPRVVERRRQLGCFAKRGFRLRQTFGGQQRLAQRVLGVRLLRADRHVVLKRLDGGIGFSFAEARVAEEVQRRAVFRIQRDCLLEGGGRAGVVLRREQQGLAEQEVRARIGRAQFSQLARRLDRLLRVAAPDCIEGRDQRSFGLVQPGGLLIGLFLIAEPVRTGAGRTTQRAGADELRIDLQRRVELLRGFIEMDVFEQIEAGHEVTQGVRRGGGVGNLGRRLLNSWRGSAGARRQHEDRGGNDQPFHRTSLEVRVRNVARTVAGRDDARNDEPYLGAGDVD